MRSLLAVLFVAVSAHAGLVAGPERAVTAPSFSAAYGINRVSTLATDGTDFLTVWSEDTVGREGFYATIVNETGATRPFAPQPIVRGTQAWSAHAVWTGDAYLVLLVADGVTMSLRLDRDARVIAGPAPLEVQQAVSGLAWNGRHALATTYNPTGGMFGSGAALLDAHGRVVQAFTLPAVNYSTVVAAGDGFVIVRSKFDGDFNGPGPLVTTLSAIRVTDDGTVGAPVEIGKLNSYSTFNVAAKGDRIGIIALETIGSKRELRRFTVDADTLVTETLPPVTLPQSIAGLDVIAAGQGFLASWMFTENNGQRTMFGSITFDAAATPRAIVIPHVGAAHFSLESNGRTAFAVWGGAPVRGMAFDAALTRNTTELTQIATAAVRQSRPALAASADGSLLAWLEETSYSVGNVVVRRFDRAGNALDAQPRVVGGNAEWYVTPAIAFTGKVWLVAWQSGRSLPEMHVYVRRLAVDGTPLDAQPIDLGLGLYPALASNGKVAVLAMTTIGHKGMAATRFNADGERIDASPFPIDDDRGYSPALATNGREFLAVWEASPIKWQGPIGIVGVRFGEDGAPLDPNPIEIALAYKSVEPHVASNGTDFLVTYTQFRPNVPDDPTPHRVIYRTHAKRVLRTGALADHTAQEHGYLLDTGRASRVAALGQTYVVTFAREAGSQLTLHAMRTDERGVGVESQSVPNGESYSSEHALASHGHSATLVYPRIEPSLSRVQRLYLRTIGTGEPAPGRRRAARR